MEIKDRRVQPGWRSNANTKSNGYTYSYAYGYTNRDSNDYPYRYTYAGTSFSDAEASPDAASETVAGSALLLYGKLFSFPYSGSREGVERDGQK